MRGRMLLVLACAVALSGCITQQEMAERQIAAQKAAQASRENRCASFGYQRGTVDYSRCMQAMYVQDQQQVAAMQAQENAQRQAWADRLHRAGAALQAAGAPPPMQPMQTTQCQMLAGMMQCHTF